MDGLNFSRRNERAGIYFCGENGFAANTDAWQTATNGCDSVTVTAGGFTVTCNPNGVDITVSDGGSLRFVGKTEHITAVKADELHMTSRGTDYALRLTRGSFSAADGRVEILPADGKITFSI